jgi:hypothetical protein
MEGLYKVVNVDWSTGVLALQGAGSKRFRVQLGPQALSGFQPGMSVVLKKTESGGLRLEAKKPGKLDAPTGSGDASGEEQHRRDRRAAQRIVFAGQTAVTAGGRTVRYLAKDISARGISLSLPKHEKLEGPLEVSFKLPGAHRQLRVSGDVARVARTVSEAVWGIRFSKVAADVAGALQAFVAAGAGGTRAAGSGTRMDHTLAGLYDDAVAGLGES